MAEQLPNYLPEHIHPRLGNPDHHRGSNPEALLLVFLFGFSFPYSLGFCSANFRKERLGCCWSRHFAQQQSPSCDLASVNRVSGIIVLPERCTFQRESSERTLGTGVGQYLCIHLPIRTRLSVPSNWARSRGCIPSNLKITLKQPLHPFVILNDQY